MLFRFDRLKASMAGISLSEAQQAVAFAIGGSQSGHLHASSEAEDLPLRVRLPLAERSSIESLDRLRVSSATGKLVPLGELGHWEKSVRERSIYHKNLMPVVYVRLMLRAARKAPCTDFEHG